MCGEPRVEGKARAWTRGLRVFQSLSHLAGHQQEPWQEHAGKPSPTGKAWGRDSFPSGSSPGAAASQDKGQTYGQLLQRGSRRRVGRMLCSLRPTAAPHTFARWLHLWVGSHQDSSTGGVWDEERILSCVRHEIYCIISQPAVLIHHPPFMFPFPIFLLSNQNQSH